MAHIFHPRYTQRIPREAQRIVHKGEKSVRWKRKDNKIIIAKICASNPTRCIVVSDTFYIAYQDENGSRKTKKAFRDRAASEKLKSQIETRVERAKVGMIPNSISTIDPVELDIEILRYGKYLASKNNTAHHCYIQRRRIEDVVEKLNWQSILDIRSDPVLELLSQMMEGTEDQRGLAPASVNGYLVAFKGFTRWLYKSNRLLTDPLKDTTRYKESEKRHPRRVLQPKDFKHLIETTKSGEVLMGLTGEERSLLYSFAASTGLRAFELSTICVSSLVLNRSPATFTIEAVNSKNRKKDTLPIPKSLVPLLREFCRPLQPTAKLFPNRMKHKFAWWNCAARTLRVDLKRANIPYRDDSGNYFDFHALRSQFITDLERAGVSLVRAQKLGRHSTPVLTAKYYTRTELGELSESVDLLDR